MISGIAWDHINVFPTYENYVEQFEIFANSISRGGILVYNAEDAEVKRIAEAATAPTRKHPYTTPEYTVENGETLLETPEGPMPISVFGAHNLNNLAGAKWICQHMGVDEDDFYEAISSFQGASKRLEKIGETADNVAYKDFAHSPSKVKATTDAVKQQYPERKLIACLELHTYSSLNSEFLSLYKGSLNAAEEAVVFYSPEAVSIKKLKNISKEEIFKAFDREDLQVFTDAEAFKEYLFGLKLDKTALLLMSSGNYGGLNFEDINRIL